MRKTVVAIFSSIFLLGCSDTEPEQATATQNMEIYGNYDLEEEHEEATIINKLIADNDDYKVVLISTRYGPRFGSMAKGEHKIKFYAVNRLDHDMFFQVDKLVIDGEVNNDYQIANYFEPGEEHTPFLFAFDFDGDLPMMEDSLSFVLSARHGDTRDVLATHEVDIEFEAGRVVK